MTPLLSGRLPRPSRPALAAVVPLLALFLHAGASQAGSMVMGTYPDKLLIVDEATGAVTEKIPLEAGLPTSLRMSNDRKRVYVTTITTSGFAVMDAATHKITSSFSLNTPTTRYRFSGGVPDPAGRYFYTVLMRIDKLADRYTLSKLQYAAIDMVQKKVVRTADVAPEDDIVNGGFRTQFMISPDGKLLYVFRDKVAILNTSDFKLVERIELSKPEGAGLENVSFGGGVDALRNPSEYVSLFNAADPYVHNKIFGIGRFDLARRKFDFKPIGPAPGSMAGLQVTPDGKDGYTVVTTNTLGNKRCEMWHFDLGTNKVAAKQEFPCRSRFTFGMSSDGKKLYIYGASYDIEVYDGQTLKYERTWNLGSDATMAGLVMLQ
jgi:DNA-binding beta-propeller fold protein YncE